MIIYLPLVSYVSGIMLQYFFFTGWPCDQRRLLSFIFFSFLPRTREGEGRKRSRATRCDLVWSGPVTPRDIVQGRRERERRERRGERRKQPFARHRLIIKSTIKIHREEEEIRIHSLDLCLRPPLLTVDARFVSRLSAPMRSLPCLFSQVCVLR